MTPLPTQPIDDWLALVERSRDRPANYPSKRCNPADGRPGREPLVDIPVCERELDLLGEPGLLREPCLVVEEVARLASTGTSRAFSGTEITLHYRRRIYVQIEGKAVTGITHCFQSMRARVANI